ncbi:MAG: Crp/Fnr family transcriptional regulator [Gammaproteobacteria bacterium]|nr:Crp/Fnr family transcriptional regulator [Gammaproteobacteria bacterium]MDH5777328.1 Crp/Fnr family transcriptional regulator [Gammaproteobacteria bacterium]
MAETAQTKEESLRTTFSNFEILQQSLQSDFSELVDESNYDWQALVNAGNIAELPKDTPLLEPNSACEQFILVLKGSVRIYQQTPDDREVTLYRIEAGQLCVLSINGLLRRRCFGAFANTESEVQALILSREQFLNAMAISSAFREYVLVNLTDRYHDVLELMEHTIFESLDTRLVCLLSRMSRDSGIDTIHITHQELARELGSSREVISRILKGLERQGCINLGRGSIQIIV